MIFAVSATKAEADQAFAQLVDHLAGQFPAAKMFQGATLESEHIDITVKAPNLGNVVVRLQVNVTDQG